MVPLIGPSHIRRVHGKESATFTLADHVSDAGQPYPVTVMVPVLRQRQILGKRR